MGYDFHITRAAEWLNSQRRPITLNEWIAYVETDPEIIQDTQNKSDDFLFVRDGNEVPLWWEEGRIYTKNPDIITQQKLLEIADHFGAHVQDDDSVLLVLPGKLLKPTRSLPGFLHNLLRFLRGTEKP